MSAFAAFRCTLPDAVRGSCSSDKYALRRLISGQSLARKGLQTSSEVTAASVSVARQR